MGNKIEIPAGTRFGKLTVIEEAEPRVRYRGCKQRIFKCLCDCGKEIRAEMSRLRSGKLKSCGCETKINVSKGTRYGRLTVIEEVELRSGKPRMFKCACDCGNECTVALGNLRSGGKKSCGCIRREKRLKKIGRTVRTSAGYISVYVGKDHPMATAAGYCMEHRLVMAEYLGRPLTDTEVVHHVNEIKLDNRLDNLVLFTCTEEHWAYHLNAKLYRPTGGCSFVTS